MAVPNFQSPPYDQNPVQPRPTAPDDARPPTPAPTAGGNQAPNLHVSAQERMPFTPNNGNPRGAHNTPAIPGLRRTRFGGGNIGGTPPEGSVVRNGIAFGRGVLTPEQQAQNEQLVANYNPQAQRQQDLMQQLHQTLLQNPTGMPFRQQPMPTSFKPGLPLSQPAPSLPVPQTPFNNGMGPPAPSMGAPQMQSQSPQAQGYPPQPSWAPPQQQGPMYRGGQDPRLGRYRPPQMVNGDWQDTGGYSYNLPNPFGPYPMFGQGPYGYGPNGG